jgi:hypothetical protein
MVLYEPVQVIIIITVELLFVDPELGEHGHREHRMARRSLSRPSSQREFAAHRADLRGDFRFQRPLDAIELGFRWDQAAAAQGI